MWTEIAGIHEGLHQAIVRDLVTGYALISLGRLRNRRIVPKREGKLRRSVKDDLHLWAHYAFRKRLEERCEGTTTLFALQDESYTSKTCGICKTVNRALGSSETFKCSECGYATDRDVNGARKILQKTLNLF